MAAPESNHPSGHRGVERDAENEALGRQPSEPPRIREIPVGIQVLRIPDDIAAEVSWLGEAALRSLVGTRVWLEPRKGQLFLHFGDVDRDPVDS